MPHNRLATFREERENGFTLIELLVVVVIIGILIAIAIPLYLNYEKGAADKSAQSDLRNAVATLELCNSNSVGTVYPSALGTSAGNAYSAMTGCTSQKLSYSSGTTLTYFSNTAATPANSAYIIESTNSGGSGAIYCYASVAGGGVAKVTSAVVTAYAAACPS